MILLIQPPFFGLEKGKGSPSLPLALVYVASLLPTAEAVRLIDLRRELLDENRVRRWRDEGVRCVGLTAMTGVQAQAAARVARRLRELGAGPIVWGGKHATLFGEHLVRQGLADYAVRGDGERTFAGLVAALQEGRPPTEVAGLIWARGGEIVTTAPPEPFRLEEIPRLPFDLLRHDYLYRKATKRAGVLETSRGCPGRCTYCYLSARAKPYWHGAPATWIVGRLAELQACYPEMDHVDFVDDNFFADRHRALEAAETLATRQPRLTWTSNGGRLRDLAALTDAELTALHRGGLDRVDIGVETGSPRLAEALGKAEPPGAVLAEVRRLLRVGIRPWVNLMIGLPDESKQEQTQTLDLALSVAAAGGLVSPIYAYTPYPGTKLADDLTAAGIVLPGPEDLAATSWSRSLAPWVGPALAARMAAIYTASLFIDDKLTTYRPGALSRLALRVLRPLSRWRLRRRQFGLPIETWLLRGWLGRDL